MNLCDTCQSDCHPYYFKVTQCMNHKERLPDVYAPVKPVTTGGVVNAFLEEYERACQEHDWSKYGIDKAAAKVLCEAAEVYHAAQHYLEGRDTIEHILEEIDHVGATAIRARMLTEREGK